MKFAKVVIYDLDNTIYPVNAISKEVASPVFDTIIDVGKEYFTNRRLREIMIDCYKIPTREIYKKYKFPAEMVSAVEMAFDKIRIDYPLNAYSDYPAIKRISDQRFLVTSGPFKFQNLKIDNLCIRQDFNEIFIHDDDEESCIGKMKIFSHILLYYGLDNEQVVVVGDSVGSEITAGNNLGLTTVQILRQGVKKSDGAKYYVDNFYDLAQLLEN
ncbi:HAD hydrolase-like protein [Mucilaginibacter pocheonensis]|uniref:Hydrolase of the HAD superfamily n=1 Tax=Mucilaginibacter pocheonensis TaxID=398050 RepID=A0ABU1TD26_9SPHI|nr:HAD hydrolase-like protein [Mucilaginibacter pocheonensis]MDR6942750.1 putative hydrolase of the HAD superfamily [Mucilaginibacter pocheonensis]